MTDVIVHMGLHRTATTTLQKCLREVRDSLKGTTVILREDMQKNKYLDMRRWHHTSGLSKIWLDMKLAEQKWAYGARSYGISSVIVSEENLVGTMPGHKHTAFYPSFDAFVTRLQRLDEYVDVHPRLVVRRQDRFLESVYAFRVARGLTDDFPTFVGRLDCKDYDWGRFLEPLQGFGDKAQIAVLENWQQDGGVAANALSFVRVSFGVTRKGRGNRRFGDKALQLLLALNRVGLMSDLKERKKALFPLLVDAEKHHSDVRDCLKELPFTKQQIQNVVSHLEQEPQTTFLPRLRAGFLGRLSDCNREFLNRPNVQAKADIWKA